MDSGCLGNHVSLQVPATTSGGPGGDTGALRESGTIICDEKEFLCVYPANVKIYLYVWYGCPEMYIVEFLSSRERNLNIRKCINELISVLVDCAACLYRSPNISAESGVWR